MHIEDVQGHIVKVAQERGLDTERWSHHDREALKEFLGDIREGTEKVDDLADKVWVWLDDPGRGMGARKGLAMEAGRLVLLLVLLIHLLGVEASEALFYALRHLEQGKQLIREVEEVQREEVSGG